MIKQAKKSYRTNSQRGQPLLPFTGVGEAHKGQVVTGEGSVGGGRHGFLKVVGKEKKKSLSIQVSQSV